MTTEQPILVRSFQTVRSFRDPEGISWSCYCRICCYFLVRGRNSFASAADAGDAGRIHLAIWHIGDRGSWTR